jgi:hypothetical protein
MSPAGQSTVPTRAPGAILATFSTHGVARFAVTVGYRLGFDPKRGHARLSEAEACAARVIAGRAGR